jgi:hypothetical protein
VQWPFFGSQSRTTPDEAWHKKRVFLRRWKEDIFVVEYTGRRYMVSAPEIFRADYKRKYAEIAPCIGLSHGLNHFFRPNHASKIMT